MSKKSSAPSRKANTRTQNRVLALNKSARHHYTLLSHVEAGVMLRGDEVKSLRLGQGQIKDAFARFNEGEVFLHNCHIPPYANTNYGSWRPDTKRPRKLLLHAKEIRKLESATSQKGLTLVPTRLYLNGNGFIKAELSLAKGKQKHDKREAIKEKDWQRQKARLLKKHTSS